MNMTIKRIYIIYAFIVNFQKKLMKDTDFLALF